MEPSSKIMEQIAHNTRPKIEEHMLIVMNKSTHEHLSQPLQTNIKQLKKAITFLTGYYGIFNVTNSNNKVYLTKSISDEDGFIQSTIPPGAYEIGSLNNEIKRIIIEEEHYTEANYPFTIKLNFSTLGSIIEISTQGPVITFVPDDSTRDPLGFDKITYEENNLSSNPIDILSFDKIFLEFDIAQGMIYKGRRSGIIHNWTMTLDPGYKYVESFTGGITWYMMESKDVICFKLKNENNQIVSFNGQSITFRLSIKEI